MNPKFWAILKYIDSSVSTDDYDMEPLTLTVVKEFTEREELNEWLTSLPVINLKSVEIISGFSLTKRVVQ